MPGPRGRGVLPRRRRREEDDEDESSNAGDLDDSSVSEGSAVSNGDDEVEVEGSEVSAEEEDTRAPVADAKTPAVVVVDSQTAQVIESKGSTEPTPPEGKRPSINGLRHPDVTATNKGPQGRPERTSPNNANEATDATPQTTRTQETLAETSRREHLEYVRQRNSNPAFVPNRGGFFLHDDRSAGPSAPYGRPFGRGRGRGYNPGYGVGRGYGHPASGPTEGQWAHDLHDTINRTVTSPPANVPAPFHIPTAKPAAVAPNRTFSVSTVLGNVTVQVFLPGMDDKKKFLTLTKRQHTLLPQHRPPLRRDKPVRISIPDEDPRYIFPSTERSFIFIPRAMRPNQQMYGRGRGRGSFHGSRRASIMGSTYTPSVAMSRKSSFGGGPGSGLHTPTDSTIPRGPMMSNFNRPVVRMPIPMPNMPGMAMAPFPMVPVPGEHHMGPTMLHSPPVSLPMHQPRPQKTVSVAEIEPPAVKAPQQQQEQPFHQQMPPGVTLADGPITQQGQVQPNLAINAPLSHIPEGAVYAQPFQPYPMFQQGGFYGPGFPSGPVVYHPPADAYGMAMGGPVLPPQFTPGQRFVSAPPLADGNMQPGAMAHESNGMVYYYDPSQYTADGSHMTQYSMGLGGGMMGIPNPGPYYYPAMPNGMFYPTTQ